MFACQCALVSLTAHSSACVYLRGFLAYIEAQTGVLSHSELSPAEKAPAAAKPASGPSAAAALAKKQADATTRAQEPVATPHSNLHVDCGPIYAFLDLLEVCPFV